MVLHKEKEITLLSSGAYNTNTFNIEAFYSEIQFGSRVHMLPSPKNIFLLPIIKILILSMCKHSFKNQTDE
jgi:hypothetical protein